MVTQPKKVERTIYFYRSFVGVSDTGDYEPFDPTPAMDSIQAFVGTPDWYQDYDAVNDDVLGLLPDGLYQGYPTARLCLIRRTAIPQLELGGTITDIPNLHQDQGVVEVTHLVFFPDNVIGSEYNHFGPRISRLPIYLREKIPTNEDVKNLRLSVLTRGDTTAILDELTSVHTLEMAVLPSVRALIRNRDPGLGAALDGIAGIGNADVVKLSYTASVNERESLLQRLAGLFKELLPNPEFVNGTSKLQLTAKRPTRSRAEPFDLLKDVMTSRREFVRLTTSKALDTQSAYQTIIAAHEDALSEIEQASTVIGP